LIVIIISIITICTTELYADEEAQASTKLDSISKFIAAPWASASTDEGISVGITAGISRFPNLLAYTSIQTSSKGYSSISLRAAIGNEKVKNILDASASNVIRYAYLPNIDKPDPYAEATVNRYQVRYSRLYKTSDPLEIGPDFLLDYSAGKDIKDLTMSNGLELNMVDGLYTPRFQKGGSVSAGLRARYATMSPNRPQNGYLVDAAFRIGDPSGELRISFARPVSQFSRIYFRFLGQFQGTTPPPVQNHLGGESTIRGEPSQLLHGQDLICARTQYHFTVLENWGFPLRLANRIWSIFPVWEMAIEGVCFYDIGSIEKPWDTGSRKFYKTRQGYGFGLRFVVPPELVLFFDVAKSPHGSPRFYIGVGETL